METLGFHQTRLNSKVYRGETSIAPDRSKLYGLGSTTANETVNLLEQLQKGTAASAESCKAMLDHLLACDDDKPGSKKKTDAKSKPAPPAVQEPLLKIDYPLLPHTARLGW